ncbi:hypothetical protein [Pseudoalteromonas luteoviolacea]|uniref:Uncharacterized protein n=1 Tax=Pseudoalteromonas luteoviolacea NCIMB 1942 TaxID=1365253 RepID=A0A167HRG3_9GAMM|nr:hypothetical protein [Pseudoalteromonas luteoviolacea]KZN58441.1 hypothetical protein N482_22245 [Pseudoalteromonas luteoviolacea NCIMB 1942]
MNKLAFFLIFTAISVSYWFFSQPKKVFGSVEYVQKTAPNVAINVNSVIPDKALNSPEQDKKVAPIAMTVISPEMERLPLDIGEIASTSDKAREVLVTAGVLVRDISEEAYVEFDLNAMQQLEVGDTFDLTIPQTTEMHRAEVTQVNVFPNGDKSVFAQVTGSDNRFHNSVMTVGSNAIYGQFTVSSGNYVFESHGKHGWIAAKRDLYKNHVEHTPSERASTEGEKDLFSPPIIKTQTTRKEN